ncbi:hypothetical protein FTUN_4566 [Frigoriglobus tundricola]|uniref:Uncharacterized protein n=1 Tax=Frigoriglobus tundricola TaxID=2774151 RepID=A0A6M5YUC2_9BACT|nr:hypothetical protein FTUN_4566 [Frigoriglobus tundricola]
MQNGTACYTPSRVREEAQPARRCGALGGVGTWGQTRGGRGRPVARTPTPPV